MSSWTAAVLLIDKVKKSYGAELFYFVVFLGV